MSTLSQRVFTSLSVLSLLSGAAFAHDSPSMAVDSNGNTVIVWETSTFNGSIVLAQTVDSAGNWGALTTISSTSGPRADTGGLPVVAIVEDGSDARAVAIWNENDGNIVYLVGAMLPSISGSWTANTPISGNSESLSSQYLISVETGIGFDPIAKTTYVSFDQFGNSYVRYADAFVNSSNSWSTPVTVSP